MNRSFKRHFSNLVFPSISLVFIIALTLGSAARGSSSVSTLKGNEPQGAFVGPTVVASTSDRVILSMNSPAAVNLIEWVEFPNTANQHALGEVMLSAELGAPQLPVYRSLVGIPATAMYHLKVSAAPSEKITASSRIFSIPKPMVLTASDGTQLTQVASGESGFDESSSLYPENAIKIVEETWIRDQRIVVLEFYPFQIVPGEETIVYHPTLTAELSLAYSDSESTVQLTRPSPERPGDVLYDDTLSQVILNYDSAKDWQAFPASLPFVSDFPIANGTPGVKIVVDHAGIYQISFEELVAAGMNPGGINPANLNLLNIDADVAFEFLGDGDTLFEPGEGLRFYGEPLPAQRLEALYQEIMAPWISMCSNCDLRELIENYTNENTYWLYVSATPGLRIQTLSGAPTYAYPIPAVFTDTQYAEQDLIWYSFHFTSSDVWFWNQVRLSSGSLKYSLPVDLGVIAESGPPAYIHGEIFSINSGSHHTKFDLNSMYSWETDWYGSQRYVFTQTIPLSSLQIGQNLLGWETQYVSTPENQLFDRFRIDYSRQFVAVNDRLAFNYHLPGSWQYEIRSLNSSGAVVYDISNPLLPVKIQDALVTLDGTDYKIAFEVTQAAPTRFYLVGDGSVENPKSIQWYKPPDLEPEAGADYIFIAHQDFLVATQALADYRASQGLRTVVVDIADIYDQYNFGIYHPIAIRNYLERAMLTWPGTAPQYVLLVGGGTFEIRQQDNVYVDEPNYIPPALGITDPWQGEIDGTSLLAAVIGTDIVPDLAIGRLPVKTAAEVDVVTAKTIAYEQAQPGDWQRKIVYIADNTEPRDTSSFETSSDNLALNYTPPGFVTNKFYVSTYCVVDNQLVSPCPNITNAIATNLNTDGALFVNYTGHGSIYYWAGGPTVFSRANVDALTNGSRLPVVLSWTCLDGFFYYPVRTDRTTQSTPSLVETWLLSSGKGAVATFSPSGLGVGTGHDILASGFYDSIFRDGNWDLGAASISAKIKLYSTGLFLDLINSYSVFGDPALRLSSPYRMQVSPDTSSGIQAAGKTIDYQVTVQNSGLVEDNYLVAFSGNVWTVNAPATLGPVPAGSQVTFTVSVDVPVSAAPGDMDQVLIEVASKGDASQVDSVVIKSGITTILQYLPAIFKP